MGIFQVTPKRVILKTMGASLKWSCEMRSFNNDCIFFVLLCDSLLNFKVLDDGLYILLNHLAATSSVRLVVVAAVSRHNTRLPHYFEI